ncbi:MAG: carbohydrate-binding family V/XII, partial [Verrucomicrobia bacterium]|nr:carbohydrate-binding family V/XII [Verrucomicrobiota bacterium]
MNIRHLLACLLVGLAICGGRQGQLQAQDLQPGQKIDPAFLEWPRVFATNGYEFAVYQPQVSKWQGNQLEGRFATAARTAGTSNETYGVVSFTARTEIDKVNRLVTLEDFKVIKVDFPMDKALQKEFLAVEPALQVATAKVIPLDHLEAVFAASADISKQRVEQVKNDPPRVIYTTKPSVLVLVDGPPILRPLTGDYQRVVNTRAVLLLNTNSPNQGSYLYGAGRWYKAPSLEGPWAVMSSLAPGLDTALAAAQATGEVDLLPPKDTNAPPPVLQVNVSTVPTELIETTGAASMQSVTDTHLLYVANTSNALFYCLDDASYYALLSGRWFKGKSLSGPWAFVPPGELPADFAKIPPDHEKSNVLVSVPGTPQSQEAVVANSIPQTATIERDKAKLDVNYAGAPAFAPVEGTPLQYATNTPTPVVMVDATSYYACQGGVWFVSPSPNGPWAVATSVPSSIYTIPVSSPIHYVTYSYVYGATPEYVYVGYTPGYMGTVVAPGDVVVYGTGYYYPPVVIGATYVAYPPTYGYGWGMALGLSVGFSFGYCGGWSSGCCYQPHWGCYYSGSYNCNYTHVNCNGTSYYYSHYGTAVHATGSYGYNPYTGTAWHSQPSARFNPYTGTTPGGARGAGFNPYSGNYAAARQGAFYNPYTHTSGATRSGATGTASAGNYAAGRQAAGYNPNTGTAGAARMGAQGNANTGTAPGFSRGTAGNANTGSTSTWNKGNVYAGRDG